MSTPWYKLEEDVRIKEVYSKYSLQDFWDWWCGDEKKVMEVRIKDFNTIKEVAEKYNLPFSASGIYVWNINMLKLVMKEVRDKTTIWFGINSRKKNWNRFGFKSFGGTDYNVSEIDVLFIDIDRVHKDGPATQRDLENADKLSNLIIERLGTQGWNKNYIKICSGNGVQLLIKLDIPLRMPEVDFIKQDKTGYYQNNDEFNKLRRLIPEGIGKDIVKFSKKFKDLEVEVDKSGFNIGRVAALPYTKNFKYNSFTWRGILEIKTETNEGFSDYILSKEDDIQQYTQKEVFTSKAIKRRDLISLDKIKDNILIKYMLENKLPEGMRNNYLWFQVKCLLRDSNIDIHSKEFKDVHNILEAKHGSLPTNLPEKRFTFDEHIVNKYFFVNLIPPIYPVYPKRTKRINMLIDDFKWEERDIFSYKNNNKYGNGVDIFEDINEFKKQLVEGDASNKDRYANFLKYCEEIYGEETTKYYFDYAMFKLLSYE